MDDAMRSIINNLTSSIIDHFGIPIPITDVSAIVSKLNGRIEETPELSVDSDGFIKKDGESFVITVSQWQAPNRRNFTIAHELGHLFLHMGYLTNANRWEQQKDKCYYRKGNSEEEYEANEFAASLLMPKEEYSKILRENSIENIVDTDAIAKYFNVSDIAASNRGKWLGLLEW